MHQIHDLPARDVHAVARDDVDPESLIQHSAHRGVTVATAESLTAGALSSRLADIPGASAVLLGGIVAYSIYVKHEVLNVDNALLSDRGAVDPDVAASMACGAAWRCGADIGIATTGVAGPAAHEGQDVGTVYLGLAGSDDVVDRLELKLPAGIQSSHYDVAAGWVGGAQLLQLTGDRHQIRRATVEAALQLIDDFLHSEPPGLPNTD